MDALPYSVTVGGVDISINTDYRTGILFEETLADQQMPEDEKLVTILRLYYGEDIFPILESMDIVQEALNKIIWFYRCGADADTVETDTGDDDTSSGKDPPFSYEHDAGYIYAAFVEAYGIDLTKNRLHWWQFRALFLALPEDVQFSKIMGYRTMDIPAKMPKEQKRFYQRMKKIYKIPEPTEQIRLEKELEMTLAKGGDISKFL